VRSFPATAENMISPSQFLDVIIRLAHFKVCLRSAFSDCVRQLAPLGAYVSRCDVKKNSPRNSPRITLSTSLVVFLYPLQYRSAEQLSDRVMAFIEYGRAGSAMRVSWESSTLVFVDRPTTYDSSDNRFMLLMPSHPSQTSCRTLRARVWTNFARLFLASPFAKSF